MLVTITKEHCKGASYTNPDDCPLARALKDLGFKGFSVGEYYVRDASKAYWDMYPFKKDNTHEDDISWSEIRMREILSGEIDSYTLDIPTLKPII